MFGYMTPLTEELLVKEHILYKSIYCGLCRCMGKRVCGESRITLSYDVVFLVLIRLWISGDPLSFRTVRCAASPFRKRPIMQSNPSLEYSAAAGALLAYYHLADDAADRKGLSRLTARLVLAASGRLRRKAALPALDREISERLAVLSAAERDRTASADEAADYFGQLLAAVFREGLEGSGRRIAGEIGYHVGKWIYLADAADDFGKDRKQGNFNPLTEIDKPSLRCAMTLELAETAKGIALLGETDPGIKRLTENILYAGMPSRMEKILAQYPDPAAPEATVPPNSLGSERKSS